MTTETRTLPADLAELDFDIPCGRCDTAAEWVNILKCCGASGFHCFPHAIEARIALAEAAARMPLACGHCFVLITPADIRWEPIR